MDADLDLNLLVVLDALLEECSVTEAATRINRSVPATSRSLTRIRRLFDDPILVRSGQVLQPTPRAIELRASVHALVEAARELTQRPATADISSVSRVFTIAASDAVMCFLGAPLFRLLAVEAPDIKVFFVMEGPIDVSLRDSLVDMEVGIIRKPEAGTRIEPLFEDRLVGVARRGHGLLAGPVSLDDYIGASHLLHSRRGDPWTRVDDELAEMGRTRVIAASAPTLAASLVFLSQTDLVSTCLERLARPLATELGLDYFELPIAPRFTPISIAWHPRFDSDPVHSWLRERIAKLFAPTGEETAADRDANSA